MPRKHNSKGRSNSSGRFIALPHFMLETAAWRTLNPYGRAAYLEVAQLFDGANNGYLDMGVRRLAERMGVATNTANRALQELADRGLIEVAEQSAFSRKDRKSTAWRLTHLHCDRTHQPGSRAYQTWSATMPEKKTTVSHGDATVSRVATVAGPQSHELRP